MFLKLPEICYCTIKKSFIVNTIFFSNNKNPAKKIKRWLQLISFKYLY